MFFSLANRRTVRASNPIRRASSTHKPSMAAAKYKEKGLKSKREYYSESADGRKKDARPRRSDEDFNHVQHTYADEAAIYPPPTMELQQLLHAPLYEHVFRLRKHGISVDLGPETVDVLGQLISTNSGLFSLAHEDNSPVQAHQPSPHEMGQINQALVTVLYLKGKVSASALDVNAPFACHTCSARFVSQAEREEHSDPGKNKCKYCRLQLPCRTLREGHACHGQHYRSNSDNRPNYPPPPDSPKWQGNATHLPGRPYDV
jgi:hypothetical protein